MVKGGHGRFWTILAQSWNIELALAHHREDRPASARFLSFGPFAGGIQTYREKCARSYYLFKLPCPVPSVPKHVTLLL